ncbi:unnamed protein product [Phaedon cochleariae]|uniref:Uncharacterized protein n=1 Tax=Phaedon cochleariae TaxID=80249 RepID=A0A9N9X4R3_PHACE|nr:unnamed protein product [Phaedon cochleariae]
MSNSVRLMHRSLPAMDIRYFPEPEPRKKKRTQRGEEVFTHMLSAFYGKILTIVGIALPLAGAITTSEYSYGVFYVYLYCGSILFFLYIYIVHLKVKSIHERINNSQLHDFIDTLVGYRPYSYIRYGSFYFRMGVIGFGIGSFIYSALEVGQYFEYSSAESCRDLFNILKPVTRILFIILQMLFIFSYDNFMDVQKSKLIAKFGLMHLIATNLSDWFYVLVEFTQHDIFFSAKLMQDQSERYNQTLHVDDLKILQIFMHYKEKKMQCLNSDIMKSIRVRAAPHLAPCAVEYNILCMVILCVMWKNNCSEASEEPSADLSAELSRQSGCNTIYGRSQSQFSVDCAQAEKGLFGGVLLLAVTVISLIMFFELVPNEGVRADVALLQVNIWEAILFWTATLAVLLSMKALRKIEIIQKERTLELEHVLLLITQCGVFVYFVFQIIGACLMGRHKGTAGIRTIMRIVTPLSALVQSCCQTVFILDAWPRRCSTKTEMKRKPGRQLITFLLVINISLWVVNRLKNNQSVSHPNQMDFYGVLTWNIITHVSMPLVVSYRFQSTVCFYEIWKRVYKIRPLKSDIEVDNRDDDAPS